MVSFSAPINSLWLFFGLLINNLITTKPQSTELVYNEIWYDTVEEVWYPNTRYKTSNIHGLFSDPNEMPTTLYKQFLLPTAEKHPHDFNQVSIFFTLMMGCTVDSGEGILIDISISGTSLYSSFINTTNNNFIFTNDNPFRYECISHLPNGEYPDRVLNFWKGNWILYFNYTTSQMMNGGREIILTYTSNFDSTNWDEQWAVSNVSIHVYGMEPTESPTPPPTQIPTEPSIEPTNSPTDPSIEPTAAPSAAPTLPPPTYVPTNPSIDPTNAPTISPTNLPTYLPTIKPTNNPSITPTNRPTRIPTNRPTEHPTRIPSDRPSERPTAEPTLKPTMVPSVGISVDNTEEAGTEPELTDINNGNGGNNGGDSGEIIQTTTENDDDTSGQGETNNNDSDDDIVTYTGGVDVVTNTQNVEEELQTKTKRKEDNIGLAIGLSVAAACIGVILVCGIFFHCKQKHDKQRAIALKRVYTKEKTVSISTRSKEAELGMASVIEAASAKSSGNNSSLRQPSDDPSMANGSSSTNNNINYSQQSSNPDIIIFGKDDNNDEKEIVYVTPGCDAYEIKYDEQSADEYERNIGLSLALNLSNDISNTNNNNNDDDNNNNDCYESSEGELDQLQIRSDIMANMGLERVDDIKSRNIKKPPPAPRIESNEIRQRRLMAQMGTEVARKVLERKESNKNLNDIEDIKDSNNEIKESEGLEMKDNNNNINNINNINNKEFGMVLGDSKVINDLVVDDIVNEMNDEINGIDNYENDFLNTLSMNMYGETGDHEGSKRSLEGHDGSLEYGNDNDAVDVGGELDPNGDNIVNNNNNVLNVGDVVSMDGSRSGGGVLVDVNEYSEDTTQDVKDVTPGDNVV